MQNNSSYLALETLWSKIDDPTRYKSATESFNLFTALLDTGIRLYHNIRVTLMSSAKGIRRSELHAFHDNNHYAWKEVLEKGDTALLNRMVPIPTGMRGTYDEAVDNIHHAINTLRIDEVIQTTVIALEQLERDLLREDDESQIAHHLDDRLKKMPLIDRKDIHRFIDTLIDQKASPAEKKARDVLGSYNDIKNVDSKIFGFEHFYGRLHGYGEKLTELEKKLDLILKTIHDRDLPKPLLRSIHKLIFSVALQFDMLGVIAHFAQTIEHNFALCLKQFVIHR